MFVVSETWYRHADFCKQRTTCNDIVATAKRLKFSLPAIPTRSMPYL